MSPAVKARPASVLSTAGLPPAWAAAAAAAVLAVPAAAGRVYGPDRPENVVWYRSLRQPPYKPPDVAVPLVWTAIDGALAVAAYRLLRRPPSEARNRAVGWLALNVGLIGAWSAIFFGRKNLPAATAAAAAMVATGVAYVASAREVDRPAAGAGVPFIAWVAFATVLTAGIWRRNR